MVEFSPESGERDLLFSAHYDVVKNSPGANDDASGVAVLLGLCRELRGRDLPVRVIFFDREEAWLRTPVLRLGLLGSFWYAWRTNLHRIAAVYNLELCGSGDSLAVWPVRANETSLPALQEVEHAARLLSVQFESVHMPWWFLSGDHLPFRLRGLANALSLSLLPASEVPKLRAMLSKVSLVEVLAGRRPVLPKPLSLRHSEEDTASNISESSLRLMLALLLELVQRYRSLDTRFPGQAV